MSIYITFTNEYYCALSIEILTLDLDPYKPQDQSHAYFDYGYNVNGDI